MILISNGLRSVKTGAGLAKAKSRLFEAVVSLSQTNPWANPKGHGKNALWTASKLSTIGFAYAFRASPGQIPFLSRAQWTKLIGPDPNFTELCL